MFVFEGSGEGQDDYGSAREREAGVRGSIAMRPFRETLVVMCVCVVLDLVQVRVRFREDVCAASVCLVACG